MIAFKKRRHYKYKLFADYVHQTDLRVAQTIEIPSVITLDIDGVLTIKKGYTWDGPSGPTIDIPSFMRGALVHDALYQLMREGYLSPDRRKYADQLLRVVCLEDGMWPVYAWLVYQGVRLFGASSAAPDLLHAP